MKVFAVLLLLNCLSLAYSQNIAGEWWSYNSRTQGHDYLIIDEDLNFILEIIFPDDKQVYEGSLRAINISTGSTRYITEFVYGIYLLFGDVTHYHTRRDASINIRLYTTSEYYYATFYRDRRNPSPAPQNTQMNFGFFEFDFLPTPGMFGWQSSYFNNAANQNYFTIDIYSFNLLHIFSNSYLNLIPAKYFYSITNNSHEMSFMNLEYHWDILSLIDNSRIINLDHFFTIGPIVSFNWLHLMDFDSFDLNRYDFRAGLKLMVLHNLLFNLESGYINSNHNHGFYFSVVLGNALPVIAPILYLMY